MLRMISLEVKFPNLYLGISLCGLVLYLLGSFLNPGIGGSRLFSPMSWLTAGYLFSPEFCLFGVILLGAVIFVSKNYPSRDGIRKCLTIIQTALFGYFCLELLLSVGRIRVWEFSNPPWMADVSKNFNAYFLDRCHQYFVLGLIFLVHFAGKDERKISTLGKGDGGVETLIIDPAHPQTWRFVCGKVSFTILGLALIFSLLRGTGNRILENLHMFFPLLIGALNNNFIEEVLFRGFFLSRFQEGLGENRGNWFHAILFSFFHANGAETILAIGRGDLAEIITSAGLLLITMVLYTGIAWFFGRCARETRGIFLPWLMHTAITMSIFLSLGLRY